MEGIVHFLYIFCFAMKNSFPHHVLLSARMDPLPVKQDLSSACVFPMVLKENHSELSRSLFRLTDLIGNG